MPIRDKVLVAPAIELRGITKRFPSVLANDHIALDLRPGEVHALLGNAPSIRYLGELSEGAMRGLENQWHKIYIAWHSILGQLKVRQRAEETQGGFSLFGGKKK